MNQFRLDLDATRCAQAHQDAHCGKMLLELTQQLCTAFVEPQFRHATNAPKWQGTPPPWGNLDPYTRLAADLLPYARTKAQYSNPVCVWTRATRANFDNTIELAQALAVEFRHRFGKPHGSEAALDWVVRHRAEAQVPDGPLQPFVLAMPEEYWKPTLWFCTRCHVSFDDNTTEPTFCPECEDYVTHNAIAAYRAYYRAEKRGYWRKSRDPAKPSTWVPAKWTRRDPPEWF